MFDYHNLIRDKVPGRLLRQEGQKVHTRRAYEYERPGLLIGKIRSCLEIISQVRRSPTGSVQVLQALAEAKEALLSLADYYRFSPRQLEVWRRRQRQTDGGFDRGLIFLGVEPCRGRKKERLKLRLILPDR